MTNCLPKFYIPLLTVISTFSRVFQISFLQIVLSKDRYWTHQYCLALLSIWTQLCLWVWIHLRKYRNAIILMWDRNILALRKMPFPWVLIDLCKIMIQLGQLVLGAISTDYKNCIWGHFAAKMPKRLPDLKMDPLCGKSYQKRWDCQICVKNHNRLPICAF